MQETKEFFDLEKTEYSELRQEPLMYRIFYTKLKNGMSDLSQAANVSQEMKCQNKSLANELEQ